MAGSDLWWHSVERMSAAVPVCRFRSLVAVAIAHLAVASPVIS